MKKTATLLYALALMAAVPATALAGDESGFYLGAGLGTGNFNANLPDAPGGSPKFDGDASAWKVFGGFNFGLIPFVDLAIEGGYLNLGEPGEVVNLLPVTAGIDGLSAFGVAGVTVGPLGLFAKYGLIAWDSELTVDGQRYSQDGVDSAYGLGAKIQLGSFQIRTEVERFDIASFTDTYMGSISAVYTF